MKLNKSQIRKLVLAENKNLNEEEKKPLVQKDHPIYLRISAIANACNRLEIILQGRGEGLQVANPAKAMGQELDRIEKALDLLKRNYENALKGK